MLIKKIETLFLIIIKMDCKIYCIEDINGLKYIGSTKKKYLSQRLAQHKWDKKNRGNYRSRLLDLDNCKIYLLEDCDDDIRNEREQYWIDNDVSVNLKNTHSNKKKITSRYKNFRKSWGGNPETQNNLLLIDVRIFSL